MKRKLFIIFVLIMITTPLSGCWDRKDIETRGYVLGVAIDLEPTNNTQGNEQNQDKESIAEPKEKTEDMDLHTGSHKYAMTVQLPILRNGGSEAQGSSGGGGTGKKTLEITQVGNSFMSMQREIQSRTSLSLYYEHLQVIVISEEIAREGIEEILDFFVRDPEMRRRVKIFVSKGEAKSVLKVEPKIEEYSSIYLASIQLNARSNARIIQETDLGEVVKAIHAGVDYVLPMVQISNDEIKVSAGAAFKGDKMVDWVSELELEAIKLIRGLYLGGVITVSAPEHGQGIVTMEVTSAKSKITPVITGDEVGFTVDITLKGDYAEDVNMHTHGQLDDNLMQKLEDAYEKEVQRVCLNTINRMQLDSNADVFRFNQILQTEEPAYWEKISEHWDTIYPYVDVSVNVDVSVQNLGLVQ